MARKAIFPGVAVTASLLLHGAVGGVLLFDSGPSSVSMPGDREAVLWVEQADLRDPVRSGPFVLRQARDERTIGRPAALSPATSVPQLPSPHIEAAIPAAEPEEEPSCPPECPENGREPEEEAANRLASLALRHPAGDPPSEKRDGTLDAFLKEVREAIEKSKVYPWKARMERLEGTVTVEFSLRKGGEPDKIRIAQSSGSPLLDRSALETIRSRTRFPEFPATLGLREMDLAVPMVYRMENRD